MVISAGIYGATGYTGYELVKLLARHAGVRLAFAASASHAGGSLADVYAGGPDVPLIAPDAAPLDEVDVVFLCLPHGAAAQTALAALAAGARVVDLSADFRLRDAATYEAWYGVAHPAPDLLGEAVYGLTEYARQVLPGARLVANPGCYPTSILLALGPALCAGAIGDSGPVIANAASGVSGAGRAPKQHTHFVEVAGNYAPYAIGRSHRHLPEMEQTLAAWAGAGTGARASSSQKGGQDARAPLLIFAPHLLPVPRGILATIYAPLAGGWTEQRLREVYAARYGAEPFVELLAPGRVATLAHAVHTNRCAIGLTVTAQTLILTSAIDNLVKGAAGQAIQNMNVMFGVEEESGL
jgi:N-acetyl-gamma-glutamyl-phosphate reductase